MRPEFSYLFPLAPAAIASLYINWDLWAIISMLGAIYWFDRKKLDLSAIALGLSIATKFMPVFLLIPIALIFLRRSQFRAALQYFAVTALTFAVINLPVYLTTPEGWLRFYQLNLARDSDWGSLWYAMSSLGVNMPNTDYLVVLLLLAGFSAIALYVLELRYVPSLAALSFIVMATVMCVSKVYSPQYVLWLTPLAVIALIINYVKRSDVQGSIFASHFTWQIRTFWWYLAWNIIAFLPFIFLFFTGENTDLFAGVAISSTVFCVGVIGAAWIWIVYRAIRGLIALNHNRPMYQ
jgi:uncharacterized membrane protein